MNNQEIEEWTNRNNKIKSNILSQISGIDGLIGVHLSARFTFDEQDKINFHKIFFETSYVTFDTKIKMYEQFLTIYEQEWFKKDEIKQIFGLLKTFRRIRNDFAHFMNPLDVVLKQKSKSEMQFCEFNKFQDGDLIPISYTENQVIAMERDLATLKKLLLTIDYKIEDHKDKIKKKIKSEN